MSTNAHILSFADDTSVYLSHSEPHILYENANKSIGEVFNWFCANKLSLNPNKTKYIVIRSQQHNFNFDRFNIQIGDTVLNRIGNTTQEPSTKFLGLLIDEHLSWKHHITHINKKISCALFAIKQAKHILSCHSLTTLYFALIQPHLNYGILAWGNSNKNILHNTIILQKRAIRIINKASYNSHTDPLFKKVEVLKLTDLFEHQVACFMHHYKTNKLPYSFNNIFRSNREIHEIRLTRQANFVYSDQCKSSFSGKLPIFNFPCIWNKWIKIVPYCDSHNTFKKCIKNHLISTYKALVQCNNIGCNDCN